ncbi:MAG: sigma 54-dependent transcriptional regulator, partial [Proteobacteria bacterium]|nr:sigma 54-dependent transcriptional regulator [Pseudomonadota bacterium]
MELDINRATEEELPLVVIGLYGTTLDAIKGPKRWSRWRPTVSLFQHEDLLIDRLDLLFPPGAPTEALLHDIGRIAPETTVCQHALPVSDPWDFEEMYAALHDFAHHYHFDPERERYLIHLTTGTHVAQICLFLLTETGFFPGSLLQSSPPRGTDHPGFTII